MEYSIEDIDLEIQKRKEYQTRPDLWYRDRFLSHLPLEQAEAKLRDLFWSRWGEGYQTHQWHGTKNPIAAIFRNLVEGKWVACKAATGVGKTYISAIVVFWFLDVFEGALVVTTAPKKEQLTSILWKEIKNKFELFKRIRTQAEYFAMPKIQVEPKNPNKDGYKVLGVVAGVSAGSEANAKMAGFHAPDMLIVIDEAAGYDNRNLQALVNTCTGSHNLILALGNPNNKNDGLSKLLEFKERSVEIRISARDFPNVVLDKEVIPGAVTRQSIETRLSAYGVGSSLAKSRIDGETPDQVDNALIMAEWVRKARFADIAEDKLSVNACGIDPANSQGGDEAAVAIGQKNRLKILVQFACKDASYIADNLVGNKNKLPIEFRYCTKKGQELPYLPDWKVNGINIGIDTVGVGASTYSQFERLGFGASSLSGGAVEEMIPKSQNGQKLYNFGFLRHQMYYELRNDLAAGRIALDIEDDELFDLLVTELTSIKYALVGDKIVIEPKDQIKTRLGHSPNLADTLAYWNWVRKGYYERADNQVSVGVFGGFELTETNLLEDMSWADKW